MTNTPEERAQVVPVMRPLLPPFEALIPYLQEIDRNRWYANYGPLVRRAEHQLAASLGGSEGCVTVTGSGTAALTAALINLDLPPGSLVAVPSWTFCATAHAVCHANLTPYIVDVDLETWQLRPEAVRDVLAKNTVRIRAVVPVSVFGSPLPVTDWQAFRDGTGIPVIVDAAAAFDTWVICDVPAIVSLHATKALGAGEGGLVACRDTAFVSGIIPILNFGFSGIAVAQVQGFNGKMPEYTAAATLAALACWKETRRRWMDTAERFRPLLARSDVITLPGFGETWIGSVLVARFAGHEAQAVASIMARHGIQTRRWWPVALNEHPAFAACPWSSAANGRRLAWECLGLPFFQDITPTQVTRVLETLDLALHEIGG